MAAANDTKIIGYFAYATPTEVFCDGDACIIAGSEINLKGYLQALTDDEGKKYTVKKTRFGEVMRGMRPEDFSGPSPTGRHFVRVQAQFHT